MGNKKRRQKNLTAQCKLRTLHHGAIQSLNVLQSGVSGVAGSAGIGHSGLGQETDVFILYANFADLLGNSHIDAQLTHSLDSGLAVFFLAHAVNAFNTHGTGNLAILLTSGLGIVLQNGGQDGSASHAVRSVIQSTEGVCHGVNDTQTYVGEAHASDVLSDGHILAGRRYRRKRTCAGSGQSSQSPSGAAYR